VDWLMMGGRHIDDAQLYSNHREAGLGVRQAVQLGVPREEIFLTTKIWPNDFGFEKTTEWVADMLNELGLDYVDMVLLHTPSVPDNLPCGNPTQCRQETWLALSRFRAQGRIRHLGVSNFGKRQMSELLALNGAPIVANQFEYHPWVPQEHRDTAEWCHQRGIVVTAYGSMGSAGLATQMLSQDALQQMGAKYGKSAGQVLLRWAIEKNVSVIAGTSNPKHQAENLRIFDFRLAPEDMAVLDNIPEDARMLHFGHTPDKAP
jgi:diketogulonate reductase-like aldo/keto reductase